MDLLFLAAIRKEALIDINESDRIGEKKSHRQA